MGETCDAVTPLLAPAGTLAIIHLPRRGTPTADDTCRAAHLIEHQTHSAGLLDVERAYLPLDPALAVCATGHVAGFRGTVENGAERPAG